MNCFRFITGITFTPLTYRGDQIDLSVHGFDSVFESQDEAELFIQELHQEINNLKEDVENEIKRSHKNVQIKFG